MSVAARKQAARPRALSLRPLLASPPAFCLGSALLMVVLRLVCFDYAAFFTARYPPHHDMVQGAAFFATSAHSMRLTGEIAWWNPVSHHGYAQYFQSFFSPLAPTAGHLVWVVWMQLIRVLAGFNVFVPEYFQYLAVNYVVLPFLAFWALALFLTRVFRFRAPILLVLIVYVFSGIGLWNGAWFYFQEAFSLFLLLATALGVLQTPNLHRWLGLGAACLIQFTSFNYWTMYNSWFVAIVLGTYAWTHPRLVRRLWARTKRAARQHKRPAVVASGLFVITVGVWLVLLGSVVVEQAGNYVRTAGSAQGTFSPQDAFERVQETRTFTTELFNPNLERALKAYPVVNEMHNARYIGAFLLPLLALIPFVPWRRRERWLILSATGVLVVCLAPPFLLHAWDALPFMNRIRHFFYFYTHYWQLLLVLLAGASFDILLGRHYQPETQRRFLVILSRIITLMVLLFVGFGSVSHLFPAKDPNLQANLHAVLLVLVTSVVVAQWLRFPTAANKQLFVAVLLAVALADTTRYFWSANLVDRAFTRRHIKVETPLPTVVQTSLRRAWPDPDALRGFTGGLFDNMPVRSMFWPVNTYMDHRNLVALQAAPVAFQRRELEGPPLQFYPRAQMALKPDDLATAAPGRARHGDVLFLQNAVPDPPPRAAREKTGPWGYTWRTWRYNTFEFVVNAPQEGWLLIRQVYDPRWRLTIDGQWVHAVQANWAGMAVPLASGQHRVHMDYRPRARALYPAACVLLEATLATFFVLALRTRKTG